MKISIIIRAKNEEFSLKNLFPLLQKQTRQDFEIVLVNDNSTDNTRNIVFRYFPKHRVQVIDLSPSSFTYPFAANKGAAKAKGDLLVFLSAHAYPISTTWLADGIHYFQNTLVAGVFAYPIPHTDASIWEKIFLGWNVSLFHSQVITYNSYIPGVMGATNAIFRKDLWKKHNFQEKYAMGGEDGEWARYFLKQGYIFIEDPKFRVYHSHYQNLWGIVKQHYIWYRVLLPSPVKL